MRHLVRNADGDELLFVHEGAGHLYCDFGHLPYRDGDYLLIPRGPPGASRRARRATSC